MADGAPLLAKARRALATAEAVADGDPDSALVLACAAARTRPAHRDAARYAATALLAQGCVRRRVAGRSPSESVTRARFGDGFRGFGHRCRRRNELEQPSAGLAASDLGEVTGAVAQSRSRIDAAAKPLLNFGFFG